MVEPTTTWQHERRADGSRCLTIIQQQADTRPRIALSVAVFGLIGLTCLAVLAIGLANGLLAIGQALTAGSLGAGFLGGAWMMRDMAAPLPDSVVLTERRGDHLRVVLSSGTTVDLGLTSGVEAVIRERQRSPLDKRRALVTIELRERLQDVVLRTATRTVSIAERVAPQQARSLAASLRELIGPDPPDP